MSALADARLDIDDGGCIVGETESGRHGDRCNSKGEEGVKLLMLVSNRCS